MVSARSNLVGRLGIFCRASARDFSVGFRAAVAVELPGVADFLDFVEVQFGDEQFILVAAGLLDDFAAWVAEIALAVEFADFPRRFGADAVYGGDEIGVGHGVGGLLEFQEILGKTGDSSGGIVDDFGAVESEDARAFGEMAVVANVDTDAGVARLKDRVAGVAGREIKLFPKAGVAVGNMMLAVFAEVAAVGVNNRGSIEIHAGHLDFVYGHDKNHLIFLRELLHCRNGGTIGNFLGQFVPASLLFGAEIRAVEKFLEAEDLNFLLGGVGNQTLVLGDHLFPDVSKRVIFRGPFTLGLNQATADDTGHATPPEQRQAKSLLCARWCDKVAARQFAAPLSSTNRSSKTGAASCATTKRHTRYPETNLDGSEDRGSI